MKVMKHDYDKSIAQEVWYHSGDFLSFCNTATPKEVRNFLFSQYREYLGEEIKRTRETQRRMGLELNKVTDYLDNPVFSHERMVCKRSVYHTMVEIKELREQPPLTDVQSRTKQTRAIIEEGVDWFLHQYSHHIGPHVNKEKLTAAYLVENLGNEICIFHETLGAAEGVLHQVAACKRVKELTADIDFSDEHNPFLSARQFFLQKAEKREKEVISSTKYRKACYLVLGLLDGDESSEPRKGKKIKRHHNRQLDVLKTKLSEAECAYKTHRRARGSAYGNLRKS